MVFMASSSSSKSWMSSSSSKSTKKILDDANPCGCGLPSRIWTSRTEDNPEKKFRACSNRWVDEDKGTEPIELKLSILENNFNVYKVKTNKECVSLINELGQMRRNLWIHKCCIIMLFVLFVVIIKLEISLNNIIKNICNLKP
ncbi:hypothetical protein LXL04_017553 [Taraxacum kok-saghyz]